jgi:hypothetical protein
MKVHKHANFGDGYCDRASTAVRGVAGGGWRIGPMVQGAGGPGWQVLDAQQHQCCDRLTLVDVSRYPAGRAGFRGFGSVARDDRLLDRLLTGTRA